MSNKTPIAFRGPPKHIEWISAPKGTPAYKLPPKLAPDYPNFVL